MPATIIPSLSVPLSLVGTFGAMYLLGFSLNNLSLMALTIATGFVVDDAIVMIENISRYIEEGETPLRGGAEGRGADRLHHHLADRLADRGADPAAVHGRRGRPAVPRIRHHARGHHPDLGGGVADPGADAVRQAAAHGPARPGDALGRAQSAATGSTRLIDRYGRRSTGCSTTSALTLLVAVGTLALTVLLYVVIPKGFFPVQDTGLIQGITEAGADRSPLPAMARAPAGAGGRSCCKDPDVVSLSSFIGVDGTNTTLNSGRFLINLKPNDERSTDVSDSHPPAAAARRPNVAGISLYMQPVQDLTIDATVSRDAVPVRAGGRQSRRACATGCRSWSTGCSQIAGARRCRQRSRSRTGLSAYIADRPRHRRRASASRRRRSTTRSTTPSASASSRPSSPSPTSTA